MSQSSTQTAGCQCIDDIVQNLIKAVDKARTDKDSTRTPHEVYPSIVPSLRFISLPSLGFLSGSEESSCGPATRSP